MPFSLAIMLTLRLSAGRRRRHFRRRFRRHTFDDIFMPPYGARISRYADDTCC